MASLLAVGLITFEVEIKEKGWSAHGWTIMETLIRRIIIIRQMRRNRDPRSGRRLSEYEVLVLEWIRGKVENDISADERRGKDQKREEESISFIMSLESSWEPEFEKRSHFIDSLNNQSYSPPIMGLIPAKILHCPFVRLIMCPSLERTMVEHALYIF